MLMHVRNDDKLQATGSMDLENTILTSIKDLDKLFITEHTELEIQNIYYSNVKKVDDAQSRSQ